MKQNQTMHRSISSSSLKILGAPQIVLFVAGIAKGGSGTYALPFIRYPFPFMGFIFNLRFMPLLIFWLLR